MRSFKKDIAVLVPTKQYSRRVPGKNFRKFCGDKSLFDIKMEQVLQIFDPEQIYCCEHISEESPLYASQCNLLKFEESPDAHWPDDFYKLAMQMSSKYILIARVTTPFIDSALMVKFIDAFIKSRDSNDSAVSVVEIRSKLFEHHCKPFNFNIGSGHKYSQDIDPIYSEVCGVSIIRREDVIKHHYYFSENPLLFEINPLQGLDINYMKEWELCQKIAKSGLFNRDKSSDKKK
ncbi:MAG: hypothetical protein K0U29_05915 [Gammaproteobacteria bacterium]|nr:hypothetical protein [Gammaproteobacteria bacterium]MCH9744453.1 hypothetical protein [Gammaproteobacteria bacterium]